MELSVVERIVLQSILPAEGDFITHKLMRKLRESLSFSETEIAAIDFKNHWRCPNCQSTSVSADVVKCHDCGSHMILAGHITWDDEKAQGVIKDIHFGRRMYALCESILKRLNDEQKLTEQHVSLYEKFVEAEAVIENDDKEERHGK